MSSSKLLQSKSSHSLASSPLYNLQSNDDDVTIEDEELILLKEKHERAFRLHEDCLRENVMSLGQTKENHVKISNHNKLYGLEPGLQAKIREIVTRKLQRNSFVKELDLYPRIVYDNLQKKLGTTSSNKDFLKKMCKHFQKRGENLKEQQGFLFKKANSLHSEHFNHHHFSQLQQALEMYDKRISQRKAIYSDICYRLSNGVVGEQRELPKVNMQQGNKLIFTNKQAQPPPHKAHTTMDYKLYLNDKIRKYKLVRNVKKFREIVKFFPISLMSKLYQPEGLEKEGSSSQNNIEKEVDEGTQSSDSDVDFTNIKDMRTLKHKLLELCQLFDIKEDIEVDNGALLLFRVDVYYKEAYLKQQKQLDFLEKGDEKVFRKRESMKGDINIQNYTKIEAKTRHLKQATWLEKFADYDEVDQKQKLDEAVYGGSFDSLLKSWFEFVQISDVKESVTKIEFRIHRLKEQFEEKRISHSEVFYEFLKTYMKLMVLQARGQIIKLYDTLNFFRSVERTIYLKKRELHLPAKTAAPNRWVEGLLERRESTEAHNKTSDLMKTENPLQEDEVVFQENGIDIYSSSHQMVIYDVVLKDFEDSVVRMMQVGAHYIDKTREKTTKKDNFNAMLDDIDRQTLLVGLLEYETNYQFQKAKYVKHLVEILHNSFTFKQSMDVMRYIQETLHKRPNFDLFGESLCLSYTEETKYFERLEALAASLIYHQKEKENEVDEFQRQIFLKEEIQNLLDMQNEIYHPSSAELGHRGSISSLGEDQEVILREQEGLRTRGVGKEFEVFKPYESLCWVFYALMEVEKAVEHSVKNLGEEEKGLAKLFKIQQIALEEAFEVWEQIKYNLTLVSSIKEYEVLHCDVLLDLSNPSHHLFKGHESKRETQNQHPEASHRDGTTGGGNSTRNEIQDEEEYLRNFIEFVRLKENLLISLFSSGYQAEIYLYQTKMFGEEDIFKDVLEKAGDFQKNFLSALLNLDTVQLSFDLKDISDCRMIVLDPSKLGELRTIIRYLVLHEQLLQNALHMNYFYMLDILQYCNKDSFKLTRALRSLHSQSIFFNIMKKKNDWFILAKVNPQLFSGKPTKGEKSASTDKFKTKLESVLEVMKYIQLYVYHDALRVQTIEVLRLLRKLVQRVGLDKKNIFVLTDIFIEDKGSKYVGDISDVEEEASEDDSPSKRKSAHARILEDYFDNVGRWRDAFVLPATQDVIYMDLEKHLQKASQEAIEGFDDTQKKGTGHISLVQKILQTLDEEIIAKKNRRKRAKKISWLEDRPSLDFLKNSRMMTVLESCHYLLQIVTHELFEGTIQAHAFDIVLLQEGTTKEQADYKRNELRMEEGLEMGVARLKRLKEYVTQMVRGQKAGETKEAAKELLRWTYKQQYQLTLLASIQCVNEAQKQGNMEVLKIFRRFLIRMAFNTHNYLYKFNDNFHFNDHVCHQQQRKDPFMKEIRLQDSEIMKLIDFLFMEPLLQEEPKYFLSLLDFTREYKQQQKGVLTDLFLLKRDWKVLLSSKMIEMRLAMDEAMLDIDITPTDNLLQFMRKTGKLLKRNMKLVLIREALLCLKSRAIPFTDAPKDVMIDLQKNIEQHFKKAYKVFMKEKKGKEGKNRLGEKKKAPEEEEENDIEKFQADYDRIKVQKSVLTNELEKLFLKEGVAHYTMNIEKLQLTSHLRVDLTNGIKVEGTEKERVLSAMEEHRFLPFLYGFTNKMLNTGLFIDAHNTGECLVVPVADLERDLYDLNKSILGCYEEVEHEVQRKYASKISSLQSQLNSMKKDFHTMRRQYELSRKDQEKAIEARLAEEGTKVVFQVDMLKKKINYLLEEQDFLIRDAKEKVRLEFRDKVAQDEVAMRQLKKRFYEYKEGMYFDLTRFIDSEKTQTLKAISDKKNQIFLTTQPGSPMRMGTKRAESLENLFETKEMEDGELVSKLYSMLKKTRILYQYREIILKEKCERQINEMKKKLLAGQNLLTKLTDLQSSEATLKDGLTEAKKEIAVMDRRNKVLSKVLQRDSNEKIKLYRETNHTKLDSSEVNRKYQDVLKRKAIFIAVDEPLAGNVQKDKVMLKTHVEVLSAARTDDQSFGEVIGNIDNKQDYETFKSLQRSETADKLDRKMILNAARTQNRRLRPTTGTHGSREGVVKSRLNLTTAKPGLDVSKEKFESAHNLSKGTSYLDLTSPILSRISPLEPKLGTRGNKSSSKGFIMKKFVQKEAI